MSAQAANRLVFLLACAGVFVALVLGLAHIAGAWIEPLQARPPARRETRLLQSTSGSGSKHR